MPTPRIYRYYVSPQTYDKILNKYSRHFLKINNLFYLKVLYSLNAYQFLHKYSLLVEKYADFQSVRQFEQA